MSKIPGVKRIERLPRLEPRPAESNKGDYGAVLVIAGSRGMSGAAYLTAAAALRSGAGLVFLAVPRSIQPIVATMEPVYLTHGLAEDDQGRLAAGACEELAELAGRCDVLAVGPGLGRSDAITEVVRWVLRAVPKPTVLDADGLNAIRQHTADLHALDHPVIITPHPGELSRLVGQDVPTIQAHRAELAAEFARPPNLAVVLKGHATVVTDGARLYVNSTGNPGMASGGVGDVLTGVIAGLVGQGLDPFEAAQLGVYLHGLAGDLAVEDVGEVSLTATDLLDYLPDALVTFQDQDVE